MNKKVALISFYNPKSLGLRYIENALADSGYKVKVIFFKDFNSVDPKKATDVELSLLEGALEEFEPDLIGLSVMTSLYLETVDLVTDILQKNFDVPVIWGGVYATMFPERSMKQADFVIRGEGEVAFVDLANAITNKETDYENINNLVYRNVNKEIVINELNDLMTDLDEYGIPDIGSDNKFFIENDIIRMLDPQVKALNYELSASRGCPFVCSYCCAINLNRLTRGKGKYVRFRTVDRVMEELNVAIRKVKNIKVVHFWDEIFSDDEDWIDEFCKRYKAEINLPFEIWGHPLKTNELLIGKLKKAGLYKVVMGIQSGSDYIRRDIFNRPESNEDIIKASSVLAMQKVPQVIYDFMLRHPFETHETLKETYDMCMVLKEPFELQLHGLNFLPGTDIVDKAINMGLVEKDEMEDLMYAPIKEQYDMYWANENSDEISNFWYKLIFLTQFPSLKKKTIELGKNPDSKENHKEADKLYKRGQIYTKFRYYQKKGILVLKATFAK